MAKPLRPRAASASAVCKRYSGCSKQALGAPKNIRNNQYIREELSVMELEGMVRNDGHNLDYQCPSCNLGFTDNGNLIEKFTSEINTRAIVRAIASGGHRIAHAQTDTHILMEDRNLLNFYPGTYIYINI